nr:hypothetical protein [Tanacetum cinerariifolium]
MYGRRWICHIGNCKYAFSYEDLALIRRISFPGYGVLTDSLKTKDSNKPLLTSTGVKPTTSDSGSKPSGNTKNNRISRPPSSNRKNKVEEHPRKVKSSLNKMNYVSEHNHNALVKNSVVQIVLWYLDSGCSKHMTKNRSQLINFEVNVSQTDGFVDLKNPNHVYKLKKALYGLKQALCSWYDLLSSFLLSQKFTKGTVDPTLFVRREGRDILLSPRGIFLNQSKYDLESIKKYGMETCEPGDTPIVEKSKLDEDLQGKAIDPTRYHGIIPTLMYLTAIRPDLVFSVCMCARYQAKPTEKHLHAVK